MDKSDLDKKLPAVEKQPVVPSVKAPDRGNTTPKPEQWKMYDPNAWRSEWAANKKRR